jgi:hypothetical protein
LDNTGITLEIPVWGKPAKRGLYLGSCKKITAAYKIKFLTEIYQQNTLPSLSKFA